MPIREYRCNSCKEIFEYLELKTDDVPEKCPNCDYEKLTKIMSLSSFRLKGKGWYATDYGNGSNPSITKQKSELEKKI